MIQIIKKTNALVLEVCYRLKIPFIFAFPESIMIEPSSKCNLKCKLCPSGKGVIKRKKAFLTFTEFKKIMKTAKYFCQKIYFWNYGEPLLNKELDKMIEYANQYRIYTIVSTNGTIFRKDKIENILKAGLNKLIIGIDTFKGKEYKKFREGGNYNRLKKNIKQIIDLKKDINSHTIISLQYLIMSHNEMRLEEMKQQALSLGADEVIIKSLCAPSFNEISSEDIKFFPKSQKYFRYTNFTNFESKIIKNKCEHIWKDMLICSDGTALPCDRDHLSKFVLGNILEKSLFHTWNSKEYVSFRRRIREIQKKEVMCNRCSDYVKRRWVYNLKRIS
jgi:radical SAM protein with 4Fe4S-binding SPASM domain